MEVAQPIQVLSSTDQKRIKESIDDESPKLLNFIRKRVRSIQDAEDILQDVFVQLVNGYDTIRNAENLTSWLYGVARHKISDYTKKKRAVSFSDMQNPDDGLTMPELLVLFDSNPEDELFTSMIKQEIEDAIDELPADQQDVFIRHELEGESFKQISASAGVPVSTLLSRKRYAVLHLRGRLERLFQELND